MFGRGAMVLLATALVGLGAWAYPPDPVSRPRQQIQVQVVVARLRPEAWAALQSPLARSVVPAKVTSQVACSFAGILPPAQEGLATILKKMEGKGLARMVGQPLLVSEGGRPVRFSDADPVGHMNPGSAAPPIREVERTRLDFLPVVRADGLVSLKLECELFAPRPLVGAESNRERNFCYATATLAPGHALVLGSRMLTEEGTEPHAVPWLSDLPYVGDSFRWETVRRDEYMVLVLATPRVIE